MSLEQSAYSDELQEITEADFKWKTGTDYDDESDDEMDLENLVFGGTIADGRESKKGSDEMTGFYIDKTSTGISENKSAWEDDDDDEEMELPNDDKPRGLGNMRHQPLIKENRRHEFEKTVGHTPAWASLSSAKSSTDENDLLTTNYNYVKESQRLPKGILDLHRCTDVNKQYPSQKPVETCEFHKSAQIALTASTDCRINLFQIDGKYNSKIHSFFMEQFPIRCAHFLKSGEEIVMTSNVQWFYSYDLISGKIIKIPNLKGTDDRKLWNFTVSPDGKYLLFVSRFGQMHLVSASTKELVKTHKVNGNINDVAFTKDSQQFLAFGEEGEVTIWDIRSNSCIHSFVDDGCTSGTSISISPDGKYIACGSRSGIVTVYDDSCLSEGNSSPVKMFKNLQNSISTLLFNSTSDILAIASSEKENAIKLVHVPSLTVFSNFPGFKNNHLRHVTKLDFSPNSGYFMAGNQDGKALLYRLDHYKSY